MAVAAVSISAALLAGCPSDGDEDVGAAPDASATPINNLCDSFTTTGDRCSPVSTSVCFPMCERGGCQCVAGPEGKGIWECTSDFSCLPDASPELDSEVQVNDGATFFDAGDGGEDGSDGAEGDGSMDAADSG